jgi:phosphoribosylglycinamide formyltransferase-1
MPRKRVAIIISGRGSNMRALTEAAKAQDYPAEIAAVLSNRPAAAGLEFATAAGIPTAVVDHTRFGSDRAAFEQALHAELQSRAIDLVCLAGFMRLLTPWLVQRWSGRMLNIHPSLLPAFKGLHTHEAALQAGVRIHGATVHFVVPDLDSGPILAQAAVPVHDSDTAESLGARVLAAEHQLYPRALRLVAEGRVRIADGRCIVAAATADCGMLIVPGDASPHDNEKPPTEAGGYGKNQKPVGDWSSA